MKGRVGDCPRCFGSCMARGLSRRLGVVGAVGGGMARQQIAPTLSPRWSRPCSIAATGSSFTGSRDFAILAVLARLGLRAGESPACGLEDIDWRAGEIIDQGGKARRQRPVAVAQRCRRGVGWVSGGQSSGAGHMSQRVRHPSRARSGRCIPTRSAVPCWSPVDGPVFRRCARTGSATLWGPNWPAREWGLPPLARCCVTGTWPPPAVRQGRVRVAARSCPALAWSGPVTGLADAVADYLELRRSFGYKLDEAGRLLPRLSPIWDSAGAEVITFEHALAWAQRPRRRRRQRCGRDG